MFSPILVVDDEMHAYYQNKQGFIELLLYCKIECNQPYLRPWYY